MSYHQPPPQQQAYYPPSQQPPQQQPPPQQSFYSPPPQQQRPASQQYQPPPPSSSSSSSSSSQHPAAQSKQLSSVACDHCGTANGFPPGAPSVRCYVCKCDTPLRTPFEFDQCVNDVLGKRDVTRIDAVDYLTKNLTLYNDLVGYCHAHHPTLLAPCPAPETPQNTPLSHLIDSLSALSLSLPPDPRSDPPLTPLGHERVSSLVNLCRGNGDYSPLYSRLRFAFSSREVLNRSFLKSHEEGGERGGMMSWDTAGRLRATSKDSGIDLTSLRSCYQLLFSHIEAERAIAQGLVELLTESTVFVTEPEHLRVYLIILECPVIYRRENYFSILYKLCCRLIKIPPKLTGVLLGWLASYGRVAENEYFERMINSIQALISYRLTNSPSLYNDPIVLASVKSLGYFNVANTMDRQIVPFQRFYNEVLNRVIDNKNDYRIWETRSAGFCYCQYPFILDIASKSQLLKSEAEAQQKGAHQSGLSRNAKNRYLELKIRREVLVDTTIHQLLEKPHDLKKQLKIQFLGEEGIDAGGVKQEFFQLIIREIFNAKYGMFTYNKETNLFWFSPFTFESTQEYHLVGMIIGLAIYNGVILDLHFPPVIYKKLMSKPVVFSDLEEVDPGLFKGLEQLMEYQGDDVEDVFCRTFEVSIEAFGETHTHPLKPGGSDIPLTNQNRNEYVDLYAKHILADSIERQFAAFRKGFMTLCGGNSLALLKPEELELLVCGNPEIDFHKLEEVSQYYGYSDTSTTIRHFWELVHGMTTANKKKLLFFITGTNRVPFEGVGQISLNISRSHAPKTSLPAGPYTAMTTRTT